MPRPLILSNGRLWIGYDDRYRARDLFWPHVGHPNHLLGHSMRMGVWCDSGFSWCDGEDWKVEVGYQGGTMVGSVALTNPKMGIGLSIEEAVDPALSVLARRIRVTNSSSGERLVRLFFTQDLNLGQSDVGNTAFYNPFLRAVVHYRGPCFVVFSAEGGTDGIEQFSTGITGFNGLEGTWRDAEDGHLSGNPIAQGSVDSTFDVRLMVPGKGEAEARTVTVFGARLDEAGELLEQVRGDGVETVLARSVEDSRRWLARARFPKVSDLPEGVAELFERSLLMIRAQCDQGGAILAANDSDILATNRATYSYCWPRDGALTSLTLMRLGLEDEAARFLEFCSDVLPHDRACLMQKYRSDGSWGASWHPWLHEGRPEVPHQEDETALTLLALCRHPDAALQARLWEGMGRPMAKYLLDFRGESGLPQPSWDLWEERRGIHAFTVCVAAAALSAAGKIAGDLDSGDLGARCDEAAKAMRTAFLDRFFDPHLGRLLRMLRPVNGDLVGDPTADSAILGGLLIADFDLNDEPCRQTVKHLEQELLVQTPVGGFARYAGDYYFRVSDSLPGNPWFISTLWFAQARIRTARSLDDLDGPLEWLKWTVRWAAPSGALSEQVHPETGEPVCVSPLTWSHSEFVHTVLDWCARREALSSG
ncbi:MAG: glycoside hydrolase family 15 protein [Fimbriimonadaceae bacterium]|nr:glycoside hydrolase family 15 protein [Fimbriimonadaceae bacterium]QYK58792.1 MAG: glycoside hydrolase family 15 protein [Fimbriimonadaceae bacterium]